LRERKRKKWLVGLDKTKNMVIEFKLERTAECFAKKAFLWVISFEL